MPITASHTVVAIGTTDGTITGTQAAIKTLADGTVINQVSSSVLPTGAATEATLTAINAKLVDNAAGALTSGAKTATSQITAAPGLLVSVNLLPPAVGIATLSVYDSASAETTSLLFTAVVASGINSVNWASSIPLKVTSGLYAVLTGTTTYTVAYK